jgi:hypothetical protein
MFFRHGIQNLRDTERLVFRWLAIPWLQRDADSYVHCHNTSRRRANRNKILPNGIPDVIFEHPESVNALDFKVSYYDNRVLYFIFIL